MVDNLVSVRRYLRAMIAATSRSECLGLVLIAGRPAEPDAGSSGRPTLPLRSVLGPYLGLARPVAAGEERAGVVLEDGTHVLADGLDAQCWPGSEAAFRHELASPAPDSWARTPRGRRRPGAEDVAVRASDEIARSIGVQPRTEPVAAVLDPLARRAVVVSFPRAGSVHRFGQRLARELDGWSHRRLIVVDALLAARLERVERDRAGSRDVERIRAWYDGARTCSDDHERAVWLARCSDALRVFEPPPPTRHPLTPIVVNPRDGDLDAVIERWRHDLDRCDRARPVAEAAVRAAHGELGELRRTPIAPPDALAGWRIDHLRTQGGLRRLVRAFGAPASPTRDRPRP